MVIVFEWIDWYQVCVHMLSSNVINPSWSYLLLNNVIICCSRKVLIPSLHEENSLIEIKQSTEGSYTLVGAPKGTCHQWAYYCNVRQYSYALCLISSCRYAGRQLNFKFWHFLYWSPVNISLFLIDNQVMLCCKGNFAVWFSKVVFGWHAPHLVRWHTCRREHMTQIRYWQQRYVALTTSEGKIGLCEKIPTLVFNKILKSLLYNYRIFCFSDFFCLDPSSIHWNPKIPISQHSLR